MSRQQRRAVYKKNDREISGYKAKQIEKAMGEPVLLNVEYVEPSIRSIAGFHRDETFNNVRKGLKDQLYEHLQNEWLGNPNIELDESSVGVSPAQSTSDAMTAKELLPGTTLQFKPLAGNGPNDDLFSPLLNHMTTLIQQQLLRQEQMETIIERAETPHKMMNDVMKRLKGVEDELGVTVRKLETTEQRLETTEQKLETTKEELAATKKELAATKKELAATEQKLGTTAQKLETTAQKLKTTAQKLETTEQKLETTQQEVKDHRRKLAILTDKTQYIWYRFLLDSVRKQIAKHLDPEFEWHDIALPNRVQQATRVLDTLREKKPVRGKIHLSSAEIASYLADDQSIIRTRGNTVAHTAQQYEVRDALRLLDVDSEGREVLLDCYRLVYEADDVSLHP